MDKIANTSQDIAHFLARRWSPRAFKVAREITQTEITSLAEAARWAPSCFGAEPWSFVFCPRHLDSDSFARAMQCLAEGNRSWASQASLLILVAAHNIFTHNDENNRWHLYDSGAAALSLVLQAEFLGLRAHQMGGFVPDVAKEVFQVPEHWDCIAMIAVGEQISADNMPEGEMRTMELAPRKRKELDEKFFAGMWATKLSEY